ncbi:MAG TPA: hypothetical protein VJ802_14275 [Gemmatimonadaceae bacterium]|nr:hypothetical protein [Gemmatimonadaceae bacterium]
MVLHERWFVSRQHPVDFSQLLTAQTAVPVAIALAVTAVAVLAWRARGRREIIPGPLQLGMDWENYQRLLSWMPLIFGVHTAVPLLVAGVQLQLFVPNLALPYHFFGGLLALTEIVIALSFLYGAATRIGAALLALVWLVGAIWFGPLLLLEHTLFLGVAFFMFAMGRGPGALDMTLQRFHRPVERLVPRAVPVLRVLTGIGIVTLAFTEKLWNVPMGVEFLERYPLNFFPAIGFAGVSNADFILIAGTVELTFGLLLISGAFVRLMTLILWVPFNLTLPFLGWRELVGHLPIYGIMALLVIWGEERKEAQDAFVSGVKGRERET